MSIRESLYGRGVFGRRHPCDFFKLPGKIMDRSISQITGNLSEIILIFPDHLFGGFDFQMGKIVNHPALIFCSEQLLKLGASHKICPADFLDGEVFPDMFVHVRNDTGIQEGIIFLFYGFYRGGRRFTAVGLTDQGNQKRFQADADHLF